MMTVVSQKLLAPKIYELVLQGELVNEMKEPGQFLHIRVKRQDLLLRRPISLADINPQEKTCTLIYRVEGEGTLDMSELKSGDLLDVMGPLGHGFPVTDITPEDHVLIVGGGIGVPPLYALSKAITAKGAKVHHVLGFASKEVIFYEEAFKQLGEVSISTDDGSYGTKGHVGTILDQLVTKDFQPTAVYACGASGMLRRIDQQFHDHPRAYMSLEERMACGTGACYACVCHLQQDETKTKSKRVCKDGPVFQTGEVVI